jgi:iron complex outermembrane receptor protein
VARCRSDQSISTAPEWSLTLQSEYSHLVSDRVDGFIRGLFTYYRENPNNNTNIAIGNYGLLTLYAGIRSHDNAWEVSFFARNLTDTQKIVSYGDVPSATSINFGPLGTATVPVNYRTVSDTPRREFSLNVRYAFGSR